MLCYVMYIWFSEHATYTVLCVAYGKKSQVTTSGCYMFLK